MATPTTLEQLGNGNPTGCIAPGLHRKIIQTLLDPNWKHGVETAIDMTLLGRYYERCADHAVSIARRVYFLVTGTYASDKA